jgi:E3 ubiquitin-protein ligase NRDP1
MASQIKRKFVAPSSISQHLICSFCYEVFNDPVRADCLHTFCKGCITQWIDNQKKRASCPICRQNIS